MCKQAEELKKVFLLFHSHAHLFLHIQIPTSIPQKPFVTGEQCWYFCYVLQGWHIFPVNGCRAEQPLIEFLCVVKAPGLHSSCTSAPPQGTAEALGTRCTTDGMPAQKTSGVCTNIQ